MSGYVQCFQPQQPGLGSRFIVNNTEYIFAVNDFGEYVCDAVPVADYAVFMAMGPSFKPYNPATQHPSATAEASSTPRKPQQIDPTEGNPIGALDSTGTIDISLHVVVDPTTA